MVPHVKQTGQTYYRGNIVTVLISMDPNVNSHTFINCTDVWPWICLNRAVTLLCPAVCRKLKCDTFRKNPAKRGCQTADRPSLIGRWTGRIRPGWADKRRRNENKQCGTKDLRLPKVQACLHYKNVSHGNLIPDGFLPFLLPLLLFILYSSRFFVCETIDTVSYDYHKHSVYHSRWMILEYLGNL